MTEENNGIFARGETTYDLSDISEFLSGDIDELREELTLSGNLRATVAVRYELGEDGSPEKTVKVWAGEGDHGTWLEVPSDLIVSALESNVEDVDPVKVMKGIVDSAWMRETEADIAYNELELKSSDYRLQSFLNKNGIDADDEPLYRAGQAAGGEGLTVYAYELFPDILQPKPVAVIAHEPGSYDAEAFRVKVVEMDLWKDVVDDLNSMQADRVFYPLQRVEIDSTLDPIRSADIPEFILDCLGCFDGSETDERLDEMARQFVAQMQQYGNSVSYNETLTALKKLRKEGAEIISGEEFS